MSGDLDEKPEVDGGYPVETHLGVRIFDGSDEHKVILHHFSAIDDLATISKLDTSALRRLRATVPDPPRSAAAFNRTYLPTDETRNDNPTSLCIRPHDEVAESGRLSYVAAWSREHDLSEEGHAVDGMISTRGGGDSAPGIDILALRQHQRTENIQSDRPGCLFTVEDLDAGRWAEVRGQWRGLDGWGTCGARRGACSKGDQQARESKRGDHRNPDLPTTIHDSGIMSSAAQPENGWLSLRKGGSA